MEPKGQADAIGSATATPHDPFSPDSGTVRGQLDRILASPHFRNSKRCQALLKYVVDAYLEGSLDRVKERNIGIEVFHREPGYDTNQDSVVRTTAADVRKRLAQYYLEPGHEDEFRLALPAGCYAPEFRPPTPALPVVSQVAVQVHTAPRFSPQYRRLWPVAPLMILAAALIWWWKTPEPALDRFWKPLIADRANAVICIEQPLRLYRIEGERSDELNDKMVGNETSQPASKQVLESTDLKLSDLKLAGNQYFSFGDLMVSVKLSELLTQKHKRFQVLSDRMATYYDLRGKPAVLMGQYNNRWTLGLTDGLRYHLGRDSERRLYEVRDRQNHDKVIALASRRSSRTEEYAIVSRFFNPTTEKTVITIMGMTYKGTIAGGDFLTNPDYMQSAFQNARADWPRKNIQVVLRTVMIEGTAGPPQVVATHFW